MAAGEGLPEHERLGERGRTDPHVFRFLVTSDRGALALGFLLFVPVGLLIGGFIHPSPFEHALVQRAPIQGLYQALVISTVTGATLVLTLSQLVLSEEFGPVGEQRRRMEESEAFRRDLESVIGNGTRAPKPSTLLSGLVEEIVDRAETLQDVGDDTDDELREEIHHFVDELREDARFTMSRLEPVGFGTFGAVEAVFTLDLSALRHEMDRLRSLTPRSPRTELEEALGDLEEVFALYGSARAHVKSLYFQRELGDLSRWIIYTSFPAIVVAVASLLFFDPTAIDSGWVSLSIAAVTISIALTPFAILLAYILRLVKVSQVTFSRSPFLVRE